MNRIEKSKICSGRVDRRRSRPDGGGDLRLGLSRKVPSLSTPEGHLTRVFMLLLETLHVRLFFYPDGTSALFSVLLAPELKLYILSDPPGSPDSPRCSCLSLPTSPRCSLLCLGLESAPLLLARSSAALTPRPLLPTAAHCWLLQAAT